MGKTKTVQEISAAFPAAIRTEVRRILGEYTFKKGSIRHVRNRLTAAEIDIQERQIIVPDWDLSTPEVVSMSAERVAGKIGHSKRCQECQKQHFRRAPKATFAFSYEGELHLSSSTARSTIKTLCRTSRRTPTLTFDDILDDLVARSGLQAVRETAIAAFRASVGDTEPFTSWFAE